MPVSGWMPFPVRGHAPKSVGFLKKMKSDRVPTFLSGITVLAMALAVYDALAIPGIWGVVGLVVVYLAGGVPAARRALRALWWERTFDIDLLMVIAAVAAATVGAALEGAILLTLFSLSTTLEQRAMGKTRRAVEALMALRPNTALRRMVSGEVVEVPVESLMPEDVVVLRPGAQVPVDGVILEGTGAVDEATITGESVPVQKITGDQVFEATVNLDGVLVVQVKRGLEDSTVARMIALVTQAQAARAPSERFSEWFGQRYTIAIILSAGLAFAIFCWMGKPTNEALYRAATLLVAASPCAIVISVPAAILSALAAAARGGVLFKGGAAMETLSQVKSFAFDKTGTLTTGRMEVTKIVSLIPEDEFLSLTAGIEAQSEHHVAAAIRQLTAKRGIAARQVREARTIPSEGMVGTIDEGELWAGNPRMARRMGAEIDREEFAGLINEELTVIWVGRNDEVLGGFCVADRPRAGSGACLAALQASGVERILMMTGDRRATALRIGAELGFSSEAIYADLLPEDKVRLVAELTAQSKVAFVGDGVNDAAALARADVGIAMGAAGSEVALQSADIALLSEDMERLAAAYRLAQRTQRVIRQNLTFAMATMGVLVFSSLFFALPLPLAVIGHEGGTVLVVLNGLRLLADPIRRKGLKL